VLLVIAAVIFKAETQREFWAKEKEIPALGFSRTVR